MKLMRTLINSKALFIVTSDDPDWCRKNFVFHQDIIVLDFGPPAGHLAILASANYIIISTGSYGWWGAWLADGVTIYYKTVKHEESTRSNYFPIEWIGIGD